MYRVSEVWIALIYVVIEGYEGLNVRDERVDVLLTDAERVTALRRFRNALFHPQKELYGKKLTDFMFDEDNPIRCVAVNAAFRAFFAREVPMAEGSVSSGVGPARGPRTAVALGDPFDVALATLS